MKRPLIGGEDFETSIGQGEQVQGKVMEAFGLGKGKRKKEENECVGKKKGFVLMSGKGVVYERDVCKN
jgi:hypothetical protein